MRCYFRRDRRFDRSERWAATRHRTEQYRASARVAMNRSPQEAHEIRRTNWPQVGHRSRVFRPAIVGNVTNLPLHLQQIDVTYVLIPSDP